jgi:hypothetical protein
LQGFRPRDLFRSHYQSRSLLKGHPCLRFLHG